MIKSTMEEWKNLYELSIGSPGPGYNAGLAYINCTRVPGGVIYSIYEDRVESHTEYDRYGNTNDMRRPALAAAISFVPFPVGLADVLKQM